MNPRKSEHADWFAEEVQPHESSLRSYLRRVFPSLPDVDDLVQESYARLIRAKQAGRISYAKAFLFTTARNLALDLFRRRKIIPIDAVADISEELAAEDGPDSAETLNRQQELHLLSEAVQALPDRCRQVLTLRLLYALSHKEIAEQLGITPKTVENHVGIALRKLRELLRPYYKQIFMVWVVPLLMK